MTAIALFASEYLQMNNSQELHDTLVKVLRNTKILRRGINIAVEDKFKTSYKTNPYYPDLQNAGITDEELPILADFFDYVTKREEEIYKEYKKTHKYAGKFCGVTPALKTWQMRKISSSVTDFDFM